ncbi:FAD-dependent oxidoreductase [Erythrobacter sp. QSSC1-22B]|uniref:NAD(P)/FAD-dependent oxidoreductase n=1 Tax=Erythrobacter sp. QSSC1-22B TaxID=1860125 RepID=UPI0008051F76|nr:FAD-dependent oxidoreductase [Erythrobacter sp. QSSC1-22B]OBX19128.1 FAD-dependent oxidoreductase [Erythrobacter sp. QSSC1-22B]
MTRYDFAIVGAGMAGASLAAELAQDASVLLIEAEDRPGYHATGRSAAFWEECYGGPEIVPLTLASGPYLRDHGFLTPRGALYIGREQDAGLLDAFMGRFSGTGATIHRLDRADLLERLPDLQAQWNAAISEPACSDIDVAGLHAHYLALGRSHGVRLETRARLVAAARHREGWALRTERGETFTATTLVNAAGAWADELAALAGARPLGIQPLRRTVVQLRTDPPPRSDLPLVLDIAGGFYFKPEAGKLWLSPHDEVPSAPCDAAPEELDVAEAIERLAQVIDWRVEAVEHRWAGLRSFAPDRRPVYGFDPQVSGFAWFAGQGGFGIQTAPAAARLTAQLLLGLDRDPMTRGLDAALYAPDRFG